jgi:hypothetical protein
MVIEYVAQPRHPTPAQAGLVLRHLAQGPPEAVVVIPDWPAQAWYHSALPAAAATVLLADFTWNQARHTENHSYSSRPGALEDSSSSNPDPRGLPPSRVYGRRHHILTIPPWLQRRQPPR